MYQKTRLQRCRPDAQLIHTVLLFYQELPVSPLHIPSDILLSSLHYEIQENFLLHHSLNIPVIYPAVLGIHVYVYILERSTQIDLVLTVLLIYKKHPIVLMVLSCH